jgi:DNA-binding protein YbaB
MSLPGDAAEVDLPDREEFEDGFAAAAQTLRALRDGEIPEPEPSEESDDTVEIAGEGSSAEGRIVATVRPGGLVDSLTIDPRALYADPDELGQQLADAINAALGDLNTKAVDQSGNGSVLDPDKLAEDLTAVQDLVAERVGMLAQLYDDAMAKITASREGGDRRGV